MQYLFLNKRLFQFFKTPSGIGIASTLYVRLDVVSESVYTLGWLRRAHGPSEVFGRPETCVSDS